MKKKQTKTASEVTGNDWKPAQNMLEVIKYEHKEVAVYVKIDYLKGHISLVDHSRAWQGKEWKFTERGVQYMQGWKNILEAMKLAVEFAEVKLRMRQDEKQESIERQMHELFNGELDHASKVLLDGFAHPKDCKECKK